MNFVIVINKFSSDSSSKLKNQPRAGTTVELHHVSPAAVVETSIKTPNDAST